MSVCMCAYPLLIRVYDMVVDSSNERLNPEKVFAGEDTAQSHHATVSLSHCRSALSHMFPPLPSKRHHLSSVTHILLMHMANKKKRLPAS